MRELYLNLLEATQKHKMHRLSTCACIFKKSTFIKETFTKWI